MKWYEVLITIGGVISALVGIFAVFLKVSKTQIHIENASEKIPQIDQNKSMLDEHDRRIIALEKGQDKIFGLLEKQNESLSAFMKRSDENDKHIKEYLYDILNSLIHGNGKDKLLEKQKKIVESM